MQISAVSPLFTIANSFLKGHKCVKHAVNLKILHEIHNEILEINGNHEEIWKSMEINEEIWKSMEINEEIWKSMKSRKSL